MADASEMQGLARNPASARVMHKVQTQPEGRLVQHTLKQAPYFNSPALRAAVSMPW